MGDCSSIVFTYHVVTKNFLTITTQMSFMTEGLHHDSESGAIILPIDQCGQLRIGFTRKVRINQSHVAVEGQTFIEVERVVSDDVDSAGQTTFNQFRLVGFLYDNLLDHFGGKQRVADTTANGTRLIEYKPVTRCDVVTVNHGRSVTGTGATHADPVVFVESAFVGTGCTDGHTRHTLQGISDIPVGHLANVFRGNDVNV